jgi:hypothetical protein
MSDAFILQVKAGPFATLNRFLPLLNQQRSEILRQTKAQQNEKLVN